MSDALLKVEGAGNDFLIGTGSWAARLAGDAALAARVCHRRRGVGADGALALEVTAPGRVRLIYRNADGSRASFCGNGTRCAARVAVERLGQPTRLVVETEWAEIPAEVRGAQVLLELPGLVEPPRPVTFDSLGRSWNGHLLEVGVPHLVMAVDEVDEMDVELVAAPLRRHRALGPGGANVSFVARTPDGVLRIRTFERGVEAETLCCGSATVAAGLVEMAESGGRRVVLCARSGDLLHVEALGDPRRDPVRLSGPTRIVATVEPAPELLQPQEVKI